MPKKRKSGFERFYLYFITILGYIYPTLLPREEKQVLIVIPVSSFTLYQENLPTCRVQEWSAFLGPSPALHLYPWQIYFLEFIKLFKLSFYLLNPIFRSLLGFLQFSKFLGKLLFLEFIFSKFKIITFPANNQVH